MKQNNLPGKILVLRDLIKYKLSIAVALSSVAGYYLHSNSINSNFFFLVAGVLLLACGSAVLNQYTERITDALMERTKGRPIPSERISAPAALQIALILLASGSLLLYFIGLLPFLLGIFNVALYNFVYTSLKKKSVLSIIPGALVGAIPPMIGYSSAGGTLLNLNIIVFASFMFLWQLPHFWLIIIKYGREYKSAGFATISNYLNEKQIRNLVFTWVLSSSFLLIAFFIHNEPFSKNILIIISALNVAFIAIFYRTLFSEKRQGDIKWAFILINLFSLMIMFLIITTSILDIL